MSEAIVKNHNEVVGPEDDVYMLGDAMLNDNDAGIKYLKQLKGKIHIICGNHDTAARLEAYNNCWNVVEVCAAKMMKIKGYHFFLSHYPALTANYDDDKPLKTKVISLCGHVHTQDKWHDWDKGIIYHCEMDAHNCYPVEINTIIQDIKEKLNEV